MVVLIFAAVAVTPSQVPAGGQDPPGLTIIKQSWGKETTLSGWDSMPYSAAPGRGARRGGVGQKPHDSDSLSTRSWPARALKNYIYKALVKNAGNRVIRTVRWDYVFVDAGTREEAGRHRFHSTNKIRPGKQVSLVGALASAPPKVVSG